MTTALANALLTYDFARGDRVKFQDEIYGKKTGTVVGILYYADTPTAAVIDVDHDLGGVHWSVPIGDLTLLQKGTDATPSYQT